MDLNKATGLAIQAERAISGLTVRELARASGLATSVLNRIFKGARDINMNQIEALARAFGIEPGDIMARASEILAREARRSADARSVGD
jgi:transcriptional regulator with XRE-family HTH domain